MIAVFVVSVFAGASSVFKATEAPTAQPGMLQTTSLYATLSAGATAEQAAEAARHARELPGIQNATIGYGPAVLSARDAGPDIYLRATDASTLGFEDVPATGTVTVNTSFLGSMQPLALAPAPAANLDDLVPVVIVLGTDGTPGAMDRARTALNISGITAIPATSPSDLRLQSTGRLIQGLAVLAYLGMFVAIAIAGLSLAVATASAMLDRKRVLGLMRLMGMPVSVLRRIIIREAAVPQRLRDGVPKLRFADCVLQAQRLRVATHQHLGQRKLNFLRVQGPLLRHAAAGKLGQLNRQHWGRAARQLARVCSSKSARCLHIPSAIML